MTAAYRWSLKLHRRQPSDELRESLGQGPVRSNKASTFSVWKCVLSTAMVEENSHDLELQKLLSNSKEGTCTNANRLKENQGSYEGDDFITECHTAMFCEKKWKAVLIDSFQNYRRNMFGN